jgi:sigma-E factor negative regulatory protein RseC
MAVKTITHPGYIRKIEGKNAEIVIISTSGCASCQIKGSCNISDTEEKIIDVELNSNQTFKTGDQVTVEMKQSQGTWAVLLGYVFPFLVVLISLIILTNLGLDEALSGLISLLLMIPYYTIIYFSKDRLKKNFNYNIS